MHHLSLSLSLPILLLLCVSASAKPIIGSLTPEGVGDILSASNAVGPASSTLFAANRAVFVPLSLSASFTVLEMAWLNGATIAGHVDIGIYDSGGTLLVSQGSTAQAGSLGMQIADVADTALSAGDYYLALATDSSTATFAVSSQASIPTVCRTAGVFIMDSAFPLPATATFNKACSVIPVIVATSSTTAILA